MGQVWVLVGHFCYFFERIRFAAYSEKSEYDDLKTVASVIKNTPNETVIL